MKPFTLRLGDTVETYPDQYLSVEECRTGEVQIVPLRGNATLDLTRQVKRWVKDRFGGELRLSGKLMSRLPGDYYAQIITDARPHTSAVVGASGGFYLQ